MGQETETRHQRLSRTLFWVMLALTAVSVCAAVTVTAGIFFAASEQQASALLLRQAQDLAGAIDGEASDERMSTLQDQHYGHNRITYIAADGTVLFDSVAGNVATEENHLNRPEIVAATQNGSGASARVSATVGINTLYAAVRLEDGSFVRLGEDRYDVMSIFGSAAVPVSVVLCVLVALGAFCSSRLARRVTAPLNALDVDNPTAAEAYDEVTPLIERIGQQQQALKRQNADLERANQMRREFSSNVTHEMKTPLHVIAGYAELLRDGSVLPDEVPVFASKIHAETDALSALVDDVLSLSRLDERSGEYGELSLLDLGTVVTQCTDRLRDMAQDEGVTLSVQIPMQPLYVCAGRRLLDEIFGNLVKNAIRYNREGGRVDILVAPDGQDAVVRISDTGCGISKEDLPRIFERFFRAESSRSKQTGGTGLGLAIVKHAVDAAGGTVDVTSKVGCGSTFTVTLPMASFE